MGGVRHDNLRPAHITSGQVIAPDEQQARILPVGTGGWLQGNGIHAGNLPQQSFRFVHSLQSPLHRFLRL